MVLFKGLKEEIRQLAEELNYSKKKMYEEYDRFLEIYEDLPEKTFKKYCRDACNKKTNLPNKIEKNKLILDLEKQLKEFKKTFEENETLIHNIIKTKVDNMNVNIQNYYPEIENDNSNRIAVLHLSDIHFGKIVDFKGEDSDLNKYDKEIAKQRLAKLFLETESHMYNNNIENLVILLGGDIVSGMIHDELKYRVNESLMNEIFQLATFISELINRLPEHFKLKVVCVSGNHGRTQKRVEFEFKATNNFDYLFYLIVKNMCPGIDIDVSETTCRCLNLNGKNYLVHHGDFTRGGGNLAGAPVITGSRDAAKMAKKYNARGKIIEAIFIGHFHTHFYIPGLNVKVIGNGSVIGLDSFANELALFGEAEQNLIIIGESGRIEGVKRIFVNDIM
jgi:predicted MPP superfamily phosphohydrolase